MKHDQEKKYLEISRKEVLFFLMGVVACLTFLVTAGLGFAVYYAGTQQIISTVTTGTAPLSIVSTTKVTNLNADLLDGYEAAALNDSPAAWTCSRDATSTDQGTGTNTGAASCTGINKTIDGGCTWRYWGNSIDLISGFPTDQGWTCQASSAMTNVSSSAATGYAGCCA